MPDQLELLNPPLARARDPATSKAAAAVVEVLLTELQAKVLEAFRRRGPLTARTAERLPEFADYGFSTVRKRISELAALGCLEPAGVDRSRRAPATIYRIREG